MNHEPESNRDPLDKILDASLARYNNAGEPRAGLEDRILANLRSQPLGQPSRWFSWQWMTASAVAVAAVVLIAVLLMPRTQLQQRPTIAAHSNAAPNATESNLSRPTTPTIAAAPRNPTLRGEAAKGWGTPSLVARHHSPAAKETLSAHNQQVAVAAAVPHLEVFPAPAPLSPQERMLFSYVRRTPREVLVAVSEEQQLHEQEWMQGEQGLQPAPSQRSEQKTENLK